MKRVCFSISLLFAYVLLSGQYDPRENFYDAEFFFAEEDYAEALYAFTQVYNDGYENNANINYRIGVCLLNIKDREAEAIPYLEMAVENITDKYKEGSFKEEQAPRDALLYLANAYRIDNQFQSAIKYYNAYLDYDEVDNETQAVYATNQIEACKRAEKEIAGKSAKSGFDVGTLGQLNEIRAPVYNPAISGDRSTFAFMGKQKFYNGVYISRTKDGKWLKPYNITPSIQSDGNQNVLSLSYDGNKLLLAWYDGFESDIWMTVYDNDRWNISKPLPDPINSRYFESHACFTPDGNTIYFTSNRRESLGGMDIFSSTKKADGSWGEIKVLGRNVNTLLNEEGPFVSPDGKRLYFSSQGHSGLGGFDVFYCNINDDGTFGEPVNLDYPLNTTGDDFTFSPEIVEFDQSLTLYAKSTSDDVDLYRFEWIPETAQPVAVAFDAPVGDEETLAEEVEETVEEAMDVVEEAVAEETEDVTEEAEDAIEEAKMVAQEVAEEVEEDIEEVEETETVSVDEIISELKLIRPVYFGFDSYALSDNSQKKLNDIVDILNAYPSVELEVVGHTDALGASEYNIILSKRRAQAVADYLADKGINRDRITIKGVGESDHVAINRTEDNRDVPQGRALNRRVHFETSVPGGKYIELDEVNVPDELKIK